MYLIMFVNESNHFQGQKPHKKQFIKIKLVLCLDDFFARVLWETCKIIVNICKFVRTCLQGPLSSSILRHPSLGFSYTNPFMTQYPSHKQLSFHNLDKIHASFIYFYFFKRKSSKLCSPPFPPKEINRGNCIHSILSNLKILKQTQNSRPKSQTKNPK